jgi:hypothetical protein
MNEFVLFFIFASAFWFAVWRCYRAEEPNKKFKRVISLVVAVLIAFLLFYCWAAGKAMQKAAEVNARAELHNWQRCGKPRGTNLWEYAKDRKNAIIGEAWIDGQPQVYIQLNLAGWNVQISEDGSIQTLRWP